MRWPRSRLGSAVVAAALALRQPLFFSNQSTAAGNGDAALLDSSKAVPWTQHGGGTNVLSVQPAGMPGWPTPRGLRITHRGGVAPTFYWLTCNNIWTAPSIGQARAFRCYYYNAIDDSEGNLDYAPTHPFETEGGTGSINGNFAAMHWSGYSNGTTPYLFAVDTATFPLNGWTPGGNSDPAHPGDPMPLNKLTTYILEWVWKKVAASPDRYSLDMRISTAVDGIIRFDKNSIKAWGGTSGQTLAASGGSLPIDDAHMVDWRFGINGGFQPVADQFSWLGGFAVCDGEEFIGPYGNVAGEV